jgi:hypothetical protein
MHPKEEEPHGPPTTTTPHKPTTHHTTPTKVTPDPPDFSCYLFTQNVCPSHSGPRHHLDPCKGHRDCEDENNGSYPRRHVVVPRPLKPVVLPPLVFEEPLCSGGSWNSLVKCGKVIFAGIEGAAEGVEAANEKGKHAGEGSATRIGAKATLAGRLLSLVDWKLTYDEEREEGADRTAASITATTTTLGGLGGAAMVGSAGAQLGAAIPFPFVDVGAAIVLGGAGTIFGEKAGSDLGRIVGHGIAEAVEWPTTHPSDDLGPPTTAI